MPAVLTPLENRILEIIKDANGIRASQIAAKLGVERSQVNSLLHRNLTKYCYQDSSYKWFLSASNTALAAELPTKLSDSALNNLCRYYLNCLSLEENNGASAFLTSRYGLNYAEINGVGSGYCSSEASVQLLRRTLSQRNISAYMGYPVLMYKIRDRNQQYHYKIAPIFLFSIEYKGGDIQVNDIPSINFEVIRKFPTQEPDGHVYELIGLEEKLSLNKPDVEIEIDELIARLKSLRQQWGWREELDPYRLNTNVPISTITQEGIYNKAVIILAKRSPYTQGLESELADLAKLSEQDYIGTALHQWIHKEEFSQKTNSKKDVSWLLEVLPLNTEQEQAIRQAMSEDLTVITGPPGTGKSQVVTNLLINTVWNDDNRNVLFSSKNNKAVDVVDMRVNNLSKKPILLRIGSNQYAYRLAELIEGLLSSTADQSDKADFDFYKSAYDNTIEKYEELRKKKEQIIALRNQVDRIEQRVCLIREKWGRFYGNVSNEDIEKLTKAYKEFESRYSRAIKKLQPFLIKLFWFAVKKKRNEQLRRIMKSVNSAAEAYGFAQIPRDVSVEQCKKLRKEIDEGINALRTLVQYELLLQDFGHAESLEEIDKKLMNYKKELPDIAFELWNKWLTIRPLQLTPDIRRKMAQYVYEMRSLKDKEISDEFPKIKSQFKTLQQEMAKFLPCWAITSLSVRGRIPFQPGIFDLVVIDEASQCDIASILPLLYRAKRAVIIGDPKQLSHICSISKIQNNRLREEYNIGAEWSYRDRSLYGLAFYLAAGKEIFLRDHHRSHGDIIGFSNEEFYREDLRIATNYKKLKLPKNTSPGIRWIDVAGTTKRPAGGGAYNEAEIEKIRDELKHLVVDNGYCGSVGVVTPFRSQADKIRESTQKIPSLYEYLYVNNDFLVDTVHKFQGDERDLMIFSAVVSNGTQSPTIEFLKNTGNLFNVAVTRARSMLVVVGNMQYCSTCGVLYMERFVDYIRRLEHGDSRQFVPGKYPEGREYPYVSDDKPVSDWERLFYTSLFDAGIKTIPQYPVDKYKLDLALFHEGKKLDIEVDGEMYHRDWTGELCYRDQLRNQRLFEHGWDVKRFWVYQIRDELPWCIEQVRLWMNK